MVKRGGKKSKGKARKAVKKPKKALKPVRKPSKILKKIKKTVKKHPKASIPRKPKPVIKETPAPVAVEQPVEEVRILKKLPPAKPLKTDRQVMRVFGHEINPKRIKLAAMEAYNKRCYSIDDIPVENYIQDAEWDNLITKIGILDRVEEQLNLMYPHIDVVRKNKICLELYLTE